MRWALSKKLLLRNATLRYGLEFPSSALPYPRTPHSQQKQTVPPSPPQSSLPLFAPSLLVNIFTLSKFYKMPCSPFLCGRHCLKNYFCVTPHFAIGSFFPRRCSVILISYSVGFELASSRTACARSCPPHFSSKTGGQIFSFLCYNNYIKQLK